MLFRSVRGGDQDRRRHGPVFISFIYFSIAKLYAFAAAKALERNVFAQSLREGPSVAATMAMFEIRTEDELAMIFLNCLIFKTLHPKILTMLKSEHF